MVESFVWWCSSSWRYWYWYFVSLGTPPDTPRHTHTHTHADAETPGVTHVGGKCFQFNSSNDGHINWSPALGVWSCKGSILYPKETVVSVFLCLIEYNLQLYIIGCYLLWAFLLFTFSALSFTRVYFALAWPRFWKQRLQRVYDKFSYITLSRLFKVDSSKLMNVSKDCFGFKVG